jgi:hypothetical protein
MRLKFNKYSIFYFLLLYGIVLYLLPSKYNSLILGAHPIIAISIIFLFFFLPFYFIIIIISDLISKKNNITMLNILIVILLLCIAYIIKKNILMT